MRRIVGLALLALVAAGCGVSGGDASAVRPLTGQSTTTLRPAFCEEVQRVWIDEINQYDASGDQADLDQALAAMAETAVPPEIEEAWADWQADVGNEVATDAINSYLDSECG